MKVVFQTVLAILAIVGLVAGVTYVSQFYSSRVKPQDFGASMPSVATLTFPVKIINWDPPTLGQFEVHAPGHQDFQFFNKNSVPVDLGLMSKSCKCSDIKACVLTEEEASRFFKDSAVEAAAWIGGSRQGVLGFLCEAIKGRDASPELQRVKLNWQVLEPQMTAQTARGGPMELVKPVTVPPKASGFVRFDWDGKRTKEGPDRLKIALWTQAKEGRTSGRDYIEIEMPLLFVPALRVAPEQYDVADMVAKEQKTAEFYCWSGSRASFTLHARTAQPDPCVTCECTPLTPEECHKLGISQQSRVLAAYRVQVTIRERSPSGQQLDVGPFTRRIMLSSDSEGAESYVEVKGAVQGEFTVGSDEDDGKVLLQSFPARNGTIKEVIILSRQPGVELRTEGVKVEVPGFEKHIKATLKADGPQRWRLSVKVLSNCPPERLPRGSAIVLKIAGDQGRQLRVPLAGRAYQ